MEIKNGETGPANPLHWKSLCASLLPLNCSICGSYFRSFSAASYGLCESCSEEMPRMEWPNCSICGISLSSENDTCLSCRSYGVALPGVSVMRSVFVYHGLCQRAMHAYKSGDAKALSGFWAASLTPFLSDLCETGWIIVGAPGSMRNIRSRGYDQIRLVLCKIDKKFRSSIRFDVLRRGTGRSQKQLDRKARATNLEGKIDVRPGMRETVSRAAGVLLIDDVCTTGATLSTCAVALRAAGAKDLRALTICRD